MVHLIDTAEIILHPALRQVQQGLDGYTGTFKDLRFIVSVAREQDGKVWLHASVSRRDRQMPSYEDLMVMKRLCIGEHRYAYQVFPPKDKHINLAGEMSGLQVLHLWSCLDGPPLPDFTRGGDSI